MLFFSTESNVRLSEHTCNHFAEKIRERSTIEETIFYHSIDRQEMFRIITIILSQ